MAQPDLVLISHLHRDHLDLPSLRRLPPETPVVVPRGAAKLAAHGGLTEVIELSPGESVSVAGLEVHATSAVHDGHRDRWGKEMEPLGYVVERRRAAAPTSRATPTCSMGWRSSAPLDLALLPVCGLGADPRDRDISTRSSAAEALELLRPRLAVPIHWGTFYPLGLRRRIGEGLVAPPLEFARLAAELAPEVEVRVLQPGERGRSRRRAAPVPDRAG